MTALSAIWLGIFPVSSRVQLNVTPFSGQSRSRVHSMMSAVRERAPTNYLSFIYVLKQFCPYRGGTPAFSE